MASEGQNIREFCAVDALMCEYILENPSRFAEWLARQDNLVKPRLRTPSLSTDDVALVLATQDVMARRLISASHSMFGGL